MCGLVLAFAIDLLINLATPIIIGIATAVFCASKLFDSLIVNDAAIRLFAVPAVLGNLVLLGVLYGRQIMFSGMLCLLIFNVINLILNIVFFWVYA